MKCPVCGDLSKQNRRKVGYQFRKNKKYQRWQCTSCGATWTEGAKRPEWLVKEQKAEYGR